MKKDFNKKCCKNCKLGALFVRCDKLKNIPEYAELCSDEMQKASIFSEKEIQKLRIKEDYCCEEFKNYWLEYPIAVKEVECDKIEYSKALGHEIGCLVKIRPCGKEYENKTFLGFLLGDLPTGISQSYNRDNNILTISTSKNPAIFVPNLKKIIFGYESWWGEIENEEELKEITNEDIENVWYVNLLKNLKGDK